MYETTYPIDTAAEMLGCQQKKIITEWAKGTIRIVLDFGPREKVKPASYEDVDARFNRITPWNIADVSAPATVEYFPNELLNPKKEERLIALFSKDSGTELVTVFPSLYHEYSQSGFYFDRKHSRAAKPDSVGIMEISGVLLYGLWVVPYSEFARVHVQESFTLRPCSPKAALTTVAATFTPGGGSRRINAPDKKNLRITESDMAVMRKLLANRPSHQPAQPIQEASPEQPKSHGGAERFAMEREKILAAALYVAHHYPKEVGKSFKSHAEAIEKHSYLFWKGKSVAPDVGRIAKILSDATRVPEEWKILGGNAKSK
ncbi:hypothetical protein QF20_004492 [Salmonella enterica subsp. enterica]|nr:hypothetical protein [Salmonella enterica subsp. enterica serovar Mikawasima]EAB7504779.1 hypothetical protein [Salmonella enterica subsp. enterica]EAC0556671.1 hypothetical protein [Salmonella enterica subsp. enterica serovar Richmond]ECJ6127832.1 hypothetical protein [Salmonella enterica]ECM2619670.1 hypothetical protein [Salmonella enterica subsp. enterica serovar Newport]EDG9407644.1 hypothetical protein [Salmonella enterica subsp. enterica serovar Tennessee]EGM7163676.1 hypothetical p